MSEFDNYDEYTVRVKDRDQKITHVFHQYAASQEHANEIGLQWCKLNLKTRNLEIA